MDKTLQALAWSVLPKEFKEEVKDDYKELVSVLDYFQNKISLNNEECDRCDLIREKRAIYNKYFGHHNLTSDAEGEEMLTCEKSRVQQQYKRATQLKDDSDPKWELVGDQMERVLIGLFGSKCLPDNVATSEPNVDSSHGNVDSLEPKPAEPKFRVGDKVTVTAKSVSLYPRPGIIAGQTEIPGQWVVLVEMASGTFPYNLGESELEPYTDLGKEVVKMRLTTSKVSVYLATKEEDEEFRLLLHENGFRWISGDPLINNAYWNSYTEESKIYYFYPDKTVTYWGDKTSETLTFSEFKKQFFEEKPRKLSQETANCDYPVPDRLHIAAMAMQALLSNADRMKMYEDIASYPLSDNLTRIVARNALRYADALVAEAHKPTQC